MSYSFDSLMGQAEKIFDQNPLSGHLFLFLNRDARSDQDPVLGSGWILHLVQAVGSVAPFQLPKPSDDEQGIELDDAQLVQLLGGLDLRTGRRRRRYRRAG